MKTPHKSVGRSILIATAIALSPRPICALDPHTRITQYASMKWGASILPGSGIRAIAQTDDRYLWLGTNAGLVRFDGATFATHRARRSGDSEGGVTTLAVGPDGSLFYGTSSGEVVRMKDGSFTSIQHTAGPGIVCSLFVDRGGTLWFSLFGRSARWWTGAGPALSRTREKPVPLAFVQDREGMVYFGTEHNGLCAVPPADTAANDRCIDDGGRPVDSVPHFSGRPDAIQALYRDTADALWMGTPNGLFRWKDGKLRRFGRDEGLSHEDVWAILEDSDGNLWVGTSGGGLNRRTPDGHWSSFTESEGLSDNDVRALLEDHEHNLWIGTADGLNRLSDPRVITYGRNDGIGDQIVQSIARGAGGAAWMGTMTGMLLRLRGDTIERFPLPKEPGHRNILSLREGRDGTVWARANNRLYRLVNGTAKEQVPPGRVTAIAEDEGGLVFDIMTFGLARFDGTRFVPHELKRPVLRDEYAHFILPAHDRSLWIATAKALVHVYAGGSRTYTVADGLPKNRVRWISEDADSLWLATEGGLAQLKDGRIRALTTAQGLPENYLRLVLDDGLRNLWIVATRGVFRLEKAKVIDVLGGRAERVVPVPVDIADGLDTTESLPTNDPGFRGADGRLWFATTQGVAVVDPKRFLRDEAAPPARIEAVTVDGHTDESVPGRPLGNLHYPPGRGHLRVDYTALNLRSASAIQFRYRLEGIDDDWVNAGHDRHASYRHVPPGSYTFLVEASNRDDVWNGTPTAVRLSIRAPLYRTWPFYVAAALVMAYGGVAGYRLRIDRIRERFLAIIEERTRIARELHDTLAQGLAATAPQLAAASSLLPERPEAAQEAIALAEVMVRHSSEEVRRSIWVLRAQTSKRSDDLGPALSESLRHITDPKGIVLQFGVDGEERPLPADMERDVLRIAHEAVTNAVRHSGAKTVAVGLSFTRDSVDVSVRDDGHGFEPELWLSKRRGGHFGLLGISERVRGLGGELHVTSRPGEGTEVRCRLPCRASRTIHEAAAAAGASS